MRLHHLEMTAFGPFPGTETVDADALCDAGLFLIHGPTGAGKTSVLDAVCFALYGRVPGTRNQAKSLHSDHAPGDRAPRVELEFTIGGRRLWVARSPEWWRPKKRGSGLTKQNASVELCEWSGGEWAALSTRLDEAGQLLGRQLGMSAEQFCQVALLPQGEFARFLRSGAEERRAVLEQLFATRLYADVERWLAEQRTRTGRVADELNEQVAEVASRIEEAVGDLKIPGPEPDEPEPDGPGPGETGPVRHESGGPAPDHPGTDGASCPESDRPESDRAAGPRLDVRPEDPELLSAWAAGLCAVAREARETASGELTAATALAERARTEAEEARVVAEHRRRHAEATARAAALAAHADERAELARRIEHGTRAATVWPLLSEADRRAQRAREAGTAATAAVRSVAAFTDLPDAPLDGDADAESLAVRLDAGEQERRGAAARLDGLRAEAARLREVRDELDRLHTERTDLDERVTRTAAALQELPGRCARLEAERDTARERSAAYPTSLAARDAAQAGLAAVTRRDELVAHLAEARHAATSATDTAQDLRDRLQRLREQRIAGMAAELATGLAPGGPCPVCGSAEHPAPARAAGDVPAEEAERDAEADYERARDARERATNEATRLAAEHDAAVEAAGGRTPDAARTELAEAEHALAEAQAAHDGADRLAAELRTATGELEDARVRAQQTDRAIAECHTRTRERDDERERIAARLDAARGDDPTIEARADRLTGEAGLLRAASDAIRRAGAARREQEDAEYAGEQAAARAGFTDGAQVRAAVLGEADTAAANERRKAFDDEEAAVRSLLADADLAAAMDRPEPDLEAVEAARAGAADVATVAATAQERAKDRAARLAELADRLDGRLAAWRPAAHRHAVAAGLAALAAGTSGENRLRMKLSAYVLAARLEQVVAAANERLERMSGGRYLLDHTTDRASGDRRVGSGGLGLLVIDTWTMRPRDPATLSGGETFVGSLALALGLADVVTAEAGGAEIATLFVDEGFGTLDAETLDEVMDVLDGLRDGGRAVGVVSHVAELRSRITARLAVTKTRTGSTLATVT